MDPLALKEVKVVRTLWESGMNVDRDSEERHGFLLDNAKRIAASIDAAKQWEFQRPPKMRKPWSLPSSPCDRRRLHGMTLSHGYPCTGH